jgi:uncharacterized protein (TIGR03663 family)
LKSSIKFVLFFLVFAVAIGLRLPQLQQRPMHTDEAVHAIKFGELLENNEYKYDPIEYHGPTLNYFSLIPARIISASSIKQINEITLRIIPVIFGLLTILFLLVLRNELGWKTIFIAALFTSLSPAMVFYSRYYIQEMLLVCFTLAAIVFGYRYLKTISLKWAILTGVSLGLMYATKETSILAISAGLLALGLMQIFQTRNNGVSIFRKIFKNKTHLLVIILTAIFVSILFYSSFFTNPQGIIDSVLTYNNYFTKAGEQSSHIHSWYYYFKILFFFKNVGGSFWSEGLILIMAIVGVLLFYLRKTNYKNKNLIHFFVIFTIILTIIYSIIPYKTPWLMLSFYQGILILAAIGFVSLLEIVQKSKLKILLGAILIIGVLHLSWQSYQLNYKYYDSQENPYVYSHPQNDVFKISENLEKLAEVHPKGYEVFIQIITPNDDYWPLPWYLRNFKNVGWWNYVDENIPSAPIILASPNVEDDLLIKLYELPPPGQKNLYVPLFEKYRELRPGVEIRGYLTAEIWNLLQLRDVAF